jgi:hypothetical protein
MPDINDSKQRLEKALSGISTSEMKAVRAEVQGELSALPQTPVAPLRAGGIIPPPPAGLVESARAQERAQEQARDIVRSGTGLRTSGIEDLQQASKIASDFMTGMDRIADVLMLLVLKFGRASTLMRAVFWGILVGVVLLSVNLFVVWNISISQKAFQREQEKIQEQQAQILEKQKATQLVAGEAKKKAEAADQKATDAQQKAPEVVIDDKGKPQLILRVQNPTEGEQTTKTVAPPAKSKIKESESSGQTLEVPLKF